MLKLGLSCAIYIPFFIGALAGSTVCLARWLRGTSESGTHFQAVTTAYLKALVVVLIVLVLAAIIPIASVLSLYAVYVTVKWLTLAVASANGLGTDRAFVSVLIGLAFANATGLAVSVILTPLLA